ncbi:hypothetical protein BD410DRAFT_783624 [Rickenella mellea]|uniref:Uncharacterized protein n=1 Tax=Rickenella mellea TaxID=50990 RepID=A0A4Y7QI59_9AGAM|nr:hypothetical protein BD410DRAFT_783624 [Rickenella mellea]
MRSFFNFLGVGTTAYQKEAPRRHAEPHSLSQTNRRLRRVSDTGYTRMINDQILPVVVIRCSPPPSYGIRTAHCQLLVLMTGIAAPKA